MNSLVTGLMVLSYAAMPIGAVMCIVAAFRQSVLWGLACLFVPFASLVFIVKYWSEAKNGFFTILAGFGIVLGLVLTVPDARNAVAKVTGHPEWAAPAPRNPAKELASAIDEKRLDIATLRSDLAKSTDDASRQYTALADRRKALNMGNSGAVHQFNLDAAAYQKQVQHLKQLTQKIDSATSEVDDLLAKQAAAKPQVVIYSTSWCSVCKAAKRYMDSKGISYRDVDVEKSPQGAAEYRQLGGTGAVPMIVVGTKKMTGFSPQALDSML